MVRKMADWLFFLFIFALMICHNATYNHAHEHESAEKPFRSINDTSAHSNVGEGFMSDSRFSRAGGATSGYTFTPTASRSRIVETKYGRVQGLSVSLFSNIHYPSNRNFALKNKIVEIFFGIPYASPPVKSHRFSPTQTPIPWNDVRPAIQPSPVCPQIFPDIRNESAALKEMPKGYLEYLRRVEPYLRNQSEDCLHLNVYAPIGPTTQLKPVLVFIHAIMFAWGGGSLFDGTVLAGYADVVVVTLNFRLGVLGFLNFNDSPTTKPHVANYGLMDQIAALHWIKENIRNFGGNPDSITLMGYESGAACVNFLMTSPTVAPGLFHRSVLIAGSSYGPWSLISDPSVAAFTVAQALNCSLGNSSSSFNGFAGVSDGGMSGGSVTSAPPSRESHHLGISSSSAAFLEPVLECLKSKHYSEFTKFTLPKFSVDFGPSVDGIVIKPNFRTNMSPQMGKREVTRKYDLLFGLSSLERLTEFSEMDLEFGFESLRRDAILRTLVRNSYRYHRNEILATIINEYIDWERTAQHPITTRDMAINAVTDCLSLAPIVATADSATIKRSFFYVFEHSTKDGLYNYHRAGAGGGEELNYIFGYPLVEAATGQVLPFIPAPLPSNYSKGEMALAELWMSFISNFAHSGSPNGPIKIDSISSWPVSKERNRYKNTAWEAYDKIRQYYLEIGANKIRTKTHYRAHQMAIWLRLVPELQRSGAQMASSFHNRMRGGNDPTLYAGRLKQPEEEGDESGPEMSGSGLSPALLYDLLLGYGYDLMGTGVGTDTQSLAEFRETALYEATQDGSKGRKGTHELSSSNNGPTLTMTTCYSPVSSSVQESTSKGGQKVTNETKSLLDFDGSHFPPYSVILAITIAVGCAFLVVNVSIFAIVHVQRKRRRRKTTKGGTRMVDCDQLADSGHPGDDQEQLSVSISTKYSEPPELLKSASRTTASSFLQHSRSQDLIDALELTVKHQQKELLGEKLLGSLGSSTNSGSSSLIASSAVHQSVVAFPKHQQQLPHSLSGRELKGRLTDGPETEGRLKSALVSQQQQRDLSSLAMSVATLPRCNGNLRAEGLSSFVTGKPNPPPRAVEQNYSTLQHGHVHGTLKRGKKVDYSDNYNSDSNNENDELKV